MRPIVAAADLVVGAACPVCGRPALRVCVDCGRRWRPRPRPVAVRAVPTLPVVAAGSYDGGLRDVVLAWKEAGRDPLTDVLAHHLAASVALLASGGDDPGPVGLVPVPTSRAARRRRGGDLVLDLASAAASLLADVGVGAEVRPELVRVRRTSVQAALSATDRGRNLRHAFAVRPSRRGAAESPRLVLVDDVVTTGATAAEAARALAVAGRGVVGLAVVAATPGRSMR